MSWLKIKSSKSTGQWTSPLLYIIHWGFYYSFPIAK